MLEEGFTSCESSKNNEKKKKKKLKKEVVATPTLCRVPRRPTLESAVSLVKCNSTYNDVISKSK